jgi:hypothetical protein
MEMRDMTEIAKHAVELVRSDPRALTVRMAMQILRGQSVQTARRQHPAWEEHPWFGCASKIKTEDIERLLNLMVVEDYLFEIVNQFKGRKPIAYLVLGKKRVDQRVVIPTRGASSSSVKPGKDDEEGETTTTGKRKATPSTKRTRKPTRSRIHDGDSEGHEDPHELDSDLDEVSLMDSVSSPAFVEKKSKIGAKRGRKVTAKKQKERKTKPKVTAKKRMEEEDGRRSKKRRKTVLEIAEEEERKRSQHPRDSTKEDFWTGATTGMSQHSGSALEWTPYSPMKGEKGTFEEGLIEVVSSVAKKHGMRPHDVLSPLSYRYIEEDLPIALVGLENVCSTRFLLYIPQCICDVSMNASMGMVHSTMLNECIVLYVDDIFQILYVGTVKALRLYEELIPYIQNYRAKTRGDCAPFCSRVHGIRLTMEADALRREQDACTSRVPGRVRDEGRVEIRKEIDDFVILQDDMEALDDIVASRPKG